MRVLLTLTVVAGALLASTSSQAATLSFSVDGQAQPWSYSTSPGGLNSSYQFGTNDGVAPTAVSSGFDFSTGGTFTITYKSGQTSAYAGRAPYADAGGDTSYVANDAGGSSGNNFPSYYVDSSTYPVYLAELIGTFADATGQIVGTPFAIGNGPLSVAAPSGASELLLGINDDIFSDNTGSLLVSVTGPSASLSAVPLPAALPMFGAAVLVLGAVGYGMKRKSSATA